MLDEFTSYESRKGPRCWYAIAKLRLPQEEMSKLDEALSAQELQTRAIWRWVKLRGLAVSASSIARHRREECGCSNV
jgi:hypothetical protein